MTITKKGRQYSTPTYTYAIARKLRAQIHGKHGTKRIRIVANTKEVQLEIFRSTYFYFNLALAIESYLVTSTFPDYVYSTHDHGRNPSRFSVASKKGM